MAQAQQHVYHGQQVQPGAGTFIIQASNMAAA
jgi:hypothetical protein